MAIITRAEVKTLLQIDNSFAENESVTFSSMALEKLDNKPNVGIVYVSASTVNSTNTTRYTTLDYYTTQDSAKAELIKRIDTGSIGDTQTVYVSYTYNDYDSYIDDLIPIVQADIVEYLGNTFPDENTRYEGSHFELLSSDVSVNDTEEDFLIEGFSTGMDIALEGSYRNVGIYTISALTSAKMRLTSAQDTILAENSTAEYGGNNIRLTRIKWPIGIKPLVAQIIWYNLDRIKSKEVQSKSLGPSSITYMTLGSGGYPENIYKGLERYRNVKGW